MYMYILVDDVSMYDVEEEVRIPIIILFHNLYQIV